MHMAVKVLCKNSEKLLMPLRLGTHLNYRRLYLLSSTGDHSFYAITA